MSRADTGGAPRGGVARTWCTWPQNAHCGPTAGPVPHVYLRWLPCSYRLPTCCSVCVPQPGQCHTYACLLWRAKAFTRGRTPCCTRQRKSRRRPTAPPRAAAAAPGRPLHLHWRRAHAHKHAHVVVDRQRQQRGDVPLAARGVRLQRGQQNAERLCPAGRFLRAPAVWVARCERTFARRRSRRRTISWQYRPRSGMEPYLDQHASAWLPLSTAMSVHVTHSRPGERGHPPKTYGTPWVSTPWLPHGARGKAHRRRPPPGRRRPGSRPRSRTGPGPPR